MPTTDTDAPKPSPSQQAFDRKHPNITTRAQVEAMAIKPQAKLVLHFLLDREPKVFEREEIAKALSVRPAYIEQGIIFLQKRPPYACAKRGPEGEPLRGRHGYVPADSPLRAAWNGKAPKPEKGAKPKDAPPKAPKPEKGAGLSDEESDKLKADLIDSAKGGSNG